MKKQLICAALALVSHAALADSGSTYKVDVELRKEGGEVIGQYSKVVSDGETARYENIKFHDVTKTVTIGPDGKAVETFKPLKVGFTFNGTPIRHQGGAVIMSYDYEYLELLKMDTIQHQGVEMKVPDAAGFSVSSSYVVKEGTEQVVSGHSGKYGNFTITMNVTPL